MDSQQTRIGTSSQKLITILVAIYEAGRFIRAKIENLQQLQKFEDCWIVLLNCQDKHKESLCYSKFITDNENVLEIKYEEHATLYSTWNDGIRITNSVYIMNSNVDDMLHPSYVKLCTEYLENNHDKAVVSSRVGISNTPNQIWPNWDQKEEMPFIAFPHSTAGPCPVWRRSLHDKYGMFDERCQVIADGLIWEKWHQSGEKFGLLDKKLALYYRNPRSLERRIDKSGETLINIDKRMIRLN